MAAVFVNGQFVKQYGDSSAAYTSFVVPLDAAHGLEPAGPNVIALKIDGSYGTEHWYTGAGIYRHVWLERTPPVHVVDNGLFAPVELTGEDFGTGTVTPKVELANEAAAASGAVTVRAVLYDPAGAVVGTSANTTASLPGKTALHALQLSPIVVAQPALWSIRSPVLYHLATTVSAAGSADAETVNTTLGFRALHWDHAAGLALNGQRAKVSAAAAGLPTATEIASGCLQLPNTCFQIRGFCHHNDFTGVGMAVPERVNLFRVQALLAVGETASSCCTPSPFSRRINRDDEGVPVK